MRFQVHGKVKLEVEVDGEVALVEEDYALAIKLRLTMASVYAKDIARGRPYAIFITIQAAKVPNPKTKHQKEIDRKWDRMLRKRQYEKKKAGKIASTDGTIYTNSKTKPKWSSTLTTR